MADKKNRLIIKKGSGLPTIPVSADHRNGDWIATDIYEGEFYQDTDTGRIFSRDVDGIIQVSNGASKVYKAIIEQSSTADPSLVYGITDTTTSGVILGRVSTGSYRLICTGEITVDQTFIYPIAPNVQGDEIIIDHNNANYIAVKTYRGGVLTDGLLVNASIHFEIYP